VPYALISDIHGDLRKLDGVLAELATLGIDDGIVLGDVAQGGGDPAVVLDRLTELGWPVVLGNADQFLLDGHEEATPELLARREWSLAQLRERHVAQIRAMPMTVERDGLLAFHGSPRSFDDILFPDTEDLSPWEGTNADLLAGGHTHFQWTRRIGDALFVNPGSVGLPMDGDPRPAYARSLAEWAFVTVQDGAVAVEFRQIAY